MIEQGDSPEPAATGATSGYERRCGAAVLWWAALDRPGEPGERG